MNVFEKAKYRMVKIEDESKKNTIINRVHPLIKILVTLFFLISVVSINKYDLSKLLYFIVYPIGLIILSDVELKPFFKMILFLSPFLIFLGLSNIIFDKTILFNVGQFNVTTGMISAITLVVKNIYSILICYILLATTGIYNLCYGLSLLHVPDIITNQILLTYRYIFVLINEASEMYQSYILRAPKQKGLNYKIWGTFLGSLFMRSSVRSNELYDSMQLRGYNDRIYTYRKVKIRIIDILYLVICLTFFAVIIFMKGI